jgi:hypothetical protein
MADTDDERPGDGGLNEKLLDALVYVPAGLALSVVEDLPRLAALGRDRLGVRVSSARAVGQFAVKAGHDEFVRRSDGWFHRSGTRPAGAPASGGPSPTPPAPAAPTGRPAADGAAPAAERAAPAAEPPSGGEGSATGTPAPANGHIPAVATLAIPGFDALSASQVVQRLDGLNRSELVSVRAYEASTRGRRTILSRVDQLLDERS